MAKRKRRVPKYQQEDAARPRPGRVPADISQQAPHNSYGAVPLDYEDTEFVCIDCGEPSVWTAEDQKWWYEVAKGPIQSRAIRCFACRRRRVAEHGGTPRRSHRDRREESDDQESE